MWMGTGGALAPSAIDTLPPARQRLIEVCKRIEAAEATLDRLQTGRRALLAEAAKVAEARQERAELIRADAASLAQRIKNGSDWLLSRATGSRAHALSEKLAGSQVEAEVATAAIADLDQSIAEAERALSEHRADKQDAIMDVMFEAAAGWHRDLADLLSDLQMLLVNLSGLDAAIAGPHAEWRPDERLVLEIPSIAGRRAEAVVCPTVAIDRAREVWSVFAKKLESNPLEPIDSLRFDPVTGREDEGKISYDQLSRVERHKIDLARVAGMN